jgi:hypothetical protein
MKDNIGHRWIVAAMEVQSPRNFGYGIRRFVTATDSGTAARSKVAPGEMFLAITRTVLLGQAVASNSMKRVEEAGPHPPD